MDCPSMPEISGTEFVSRLCDGRRLPLSGSLELTERCNLHCLHCYVRQPSGAQELRQRELTTGQWCQVLDELEDASCLSLHLTGGEVLLRPDFADIYTYAKRKGFVVTVFTNGTLLTPGLVDLFHEYPPKSLSITLYGATPGTYERMTGVPGSYAMCLRGVGLLHEKGVPFQLKALLTEVNHHEYLAMRAYAEGFGLRLHHDAIIWPRMDGRAETRDLRLPPEKVVEYDAYNLDELREWTEANRETLASPDGDMLYGCRAGLRGFYINAYGQLGLCIMSRAGEYSVLAGSFAEGWQDYLPQLRYRKALRETRCRRCKIAALCAHCPAFARWENGDPETPVEYACRIAYERARMLDLHTLLEDQPCEQWLPSTPDVKQAEER